MQGIVSENTFLIAKHISLNNKNMYKGTMIKQSRYNRQEKS